MGIVRKEKEQEWQFLKGDVACVLCTVYCILQCALLPMKINSDFNAPYQDEISILKAGRLSARC